MRVTLITKTRDGETVISVVVGDPKLGHSRTRDFAYRTGVPDDRKAAVARGLAYLDGLRDGLDTWRNQNHCAVRSNDIFEATIALTKLGDES